MKVPDLEGRIYLTIKSLFLVILCSDPVPFECNGGMIVKEGV
jgi:hypothetical protein